LLERFAIRGFGAAALVFVLLASRRRNRNCNRLEPAAYIQFDERRGWTKPHRYVR